MKSLRMIPLFLELQLIRKEGMLLEKKESLLNRELEDYYNRVNKLLQLIEKV